MRCSGEDSTLWFVKKVEVIDPVGATPNGQPLSERLALSVLGTVEGISSIRVVWRNGLLHVFCFVGRT